MHKIQKIISKEARFLSNLMGLGPIYLIRKNRRYCTKHHAILSTEDHFCSTDLFLNRLDLTFGFKSFSDLPIVRSYKESAFWICHKDIYTNATDFLKGNPCSLNRLSC